MEPFILVNDKVRLSVPNTGDIDEITRWCSSDPEMIRWTTVPHPYTRKDGEEYVNDVIPSGWASGRTLTWAIRTPEFLGPGEPEPTILGMVDIGIDNSPPGLKSAAIAYGAYPPGRGQGWVTEAMRLVLDWAFDPAGMNIARATWNALVGNWPSRRVAWKLGFRIEGTIRAEAIHGDKREDCWIGTLLRDNPRQPNEPWPLDADQG